MNLQEHITPENIDTFTRHFSCLLALYMLGHFGCKITKLIIEYNTLKDNRVIDYEKNSRDIRK